MSVDERQGKRGRVFNTVGFAPIYTQSFGGDVKDSWTDTGILNLVNDAIAKNTPDGDPVEVVPFAPCSRDSRRRNARWFLPAVPFPTASRFPLGSRTPSSGE